MGRATSTCECKANHTSSQEKLSYILLSKKICHRYMEKAKEDFIRRWEKPHNEPASLIDFNIHRTIGTGSFGRVILVQHKISQDFYAMKVLAKDRIVKTRQIKHTVNEKEILLASDFPFIVKLFYYFKDNSNLYMIMCFVPGGELFSYLRNSCRFSETIAKFYASQIILAFQYLQAVDIMYRDLKPENMVIYKDGYVCLTDFGFAKKVSGRAWTFCGTPEYMAPEIIRSKGYGKAVDWWSLGIFVYEMVAGYPPYRAKKPVQIFEKILSGKLKFPTHFSPELIDLLQNLLQMDLSKRFGNLKEGAEDIKAHKWFDCVDWLGILERKIIAPYIPSYKEAGDTQNYDTYTEEPLHNSVTDHYPEEFKEF